MAAKNIKNMIRNSQDEKDLGDHTYRSPIEKTSNKALKQINLSTLNNLKNSMLQNNNINIDQSNTFIIIILIIYKYLINNSIVIGQRRGDSSKLEEIHMLNLKNNINPSPINANNHNNNSNYGKGKKLDPISLSNNIVSYKNNNNNNVNITNNIIDMNGNSRTNFFNANKSNKKMEVSIKATVSFGDDDEDQNDYYGSYELRNPNKKNTGNTVNAGKKKLEKLKEKNQYDEFSD